MLPSEELGLTILMEEEDRLSRSDNDRYIVIVKNVLIGFGFIDDNVGCLYIMEIIYPYIFLES